MCVRIREYTDGQLKFSNTTTTPFHKPYPNISTHTHPQTPTHEQRVSLRCCHTPGHPASYRASSPHPDQQAHTHTRARARTHKHTHT
uniref:Uncharacterized protein n=1 Tax=Anopheles albimanus TaxID=7167 RepID=A0A182FY83_ANOAL